MKVLNEYILKASSYIVFGDIWRYSTVCNTLAQPHGNTHRILNTGKCPQYCQILGIANRTRFYSKYREIPSATLGNCWQPYGTAYQNIQQRECLLQVLPSFPPFPFLPSFPSVPLSSLCAARLATAQGSLPHCTFASSAVAFPCHFVIIFLFPVIRMWVFFPFLASALVYVFMWETQ